MISKQVGAFLAGVIVVAAGIGAFFIYDQQKGSEYEVEADTISGDKKVSDDPTSGFKSYDGQQYFLKYRYISGSGNSVATYYTLEFNSDRPVLVRAFVDNIQMPLGGDTGMLCQKGHTCKDMCFSICDLNNCGLELLKELQFTFVKLNEKTDVTYTTTLENYTLTINFSGNVPSSGIAYIYNSTDPIRTFNLDGSNSYTIPEVYSADAAAIVVGSDIIYKSS